MLCKALGGAKKYGYDTPIPISLAVETNGLKDALWALQAVPEDQEDERDYIARIAAVSFAERVLHIYEKKYPKNISIRFCIEMACLYAHGEANSNELSAASAAAWAAEWAAASADASVAASAAASAAAWDAASAAAWAAAWAAASADASVASAAEKKAQTEIFLKLLTQIDQKHERI